MGIGNGRDSSDYHFFYSSRGFEEMGIGNWRASSDFITSFILQGALKKWALAMDGTRLTLDRDL